MYGHPAIRECCVISAPDGYRGETVKALHDNAKGSVTPEDIVAWGHQTMASYKAPSAIAFFESLPCSESNKISWRLLQDAEWR